MLPRFRTTLQAWVKGGVHLWGASPMFRILSDLLFPAPQVVQKDETEKASVVGRTGTRTTRSELISLFHSKLTDDSRDQ